MKKLLAVSLTAALMLGTMTMTGCGAGGEDKPTPVSYTHLDVYKRQPPYRSCGYLWAQDYGVDCTALQPNHMFSIPEDEYDFGTGGTKQVEQALKLASYGNIGLEMELDDHLFLRPSWYNLGLDYLNAGVKLNADGDKCYRNWYEGCGTVDVYKRQD